MFKLNRALGGALLACTLLAGQTAHADDEKPVTLLVKPVVGRVLRIKTVIKTSVMGMDLTVNESQTDTVKEVKDNGDVVTEIADEGSTINIGGQDRDQPASPAYTTTHDKFGKITVYRKAEENGFMSPEVTKLLETLTGVVMPDKAVKTNDTWQTEIDNPAVKGKKVVLKGTYLGIDKVDGKEYWKIKQTSEAVADTDGNKVSYDVTEWVNPADGEAAKVEGTVKDIPTQVGQLTMQMTSKATKVDAADKASPKKADAKP